MKHGGVLFFSLWAVGVVLCAVRGSVCALALLLDLALCGFFLRFQHHNRI